MADVTVHPNRALISSEDVEGVNVYGTDRDKIGQIDHLMIDKVSGKVAYAVLSFGGFLGIGHKHLPIPWSLLKYNVELDAYELDIADDVLRKAPSSEQSSEFDFGDRLDEAKLYSYYNVPPYWGF